MKVCDGGGKVLDSTLTIIVLTYYHEKYISRALNSILSQNTGLDYNILVADDCSGDNTIDIVKTYIKNNEGKIYLKENTSNKGICRNLYEALLMCKSKYIMITDGDDCWINDDKLESQFRFIEENSDLFGVSTLNEPRYINGEKGGDIYPPKTDWDKTITRQGFLNGECFSTVGMMFKNIFHCEKARKQFELMCEFSRDLDDLTFATFLFDYGNVYNLPILAYSTTVRKGEDGQEHNYNTKYKLVERINNEVEVLKKLEKYYSGKITFKNRYRKCFRILVSQIVKYKNPRAFKVIFKIPLIRMLKKSSKLIIN